MKELFIKCDKCGKDIDDGIAYEVAIRSYHDKKDSDVDEIDIAEMDLCDKCHSKFYMLFSTFIKNENIIREE
jgi:hypothetical protein